MLAKFKAFSIYIYIDDSTEKALTMNFMKTSINAMVAAGVITAFSTSAHAEPFTFDAGDNGGALVVAKSVYGQAVNMVTAVTDLDGDRNAELLVRFPDTEIDGIMQHTVLQAFDGVWKEVLVENTSSLGMSDTSDREYVDLVTGEGWHWSYFDGSYVPSLPGVRTIEETGEIGTTLSEVERNDPDVSRFQKPEKVLIDINNDGVKESFVFTRETAFCTGYGICAVKVFSEDKLLGRIDSEEANIVFSDGNVFVPVSNGFLIYAYDGQSLELVAEKFGKVGE